MTQVDSLLAHTFSGAHDYIVGKDAEDAVVIDSNPDAFNLLIDYLMYGDEGISADKQHLLKREMDYWGIKPK